MDTTVTSFFEPPEKAESFLAITVADGKLPIENFAPDGRLYSFPILVAFTDTFEVDGEALASAEVDATETALSKMKSRSL